MRIYIDSNTFPATPGLYADAAKTKPIPRMIPAVELQRGGFEVSFVGSNQPQDIASVSLVASIDGSGVQVVAEQGENFSDDSGDAWRFNFALNAESLVAEIAKRGSVRLRVGVIVEDDTERREWQFSTVVYPSASSEETDTEAVQSSKNFAELAEQAANRAQEAQADVAGNAQLAESAKQVATQAANAAIEAADNAEVSERNAAESKGAAEKAKTDAEAAKTEAKKAASDAQATLGNVYTKSQLDGVDTGAEVVLKMNEIIAQLKDWESVTGETLPNEFWVEVFNAFERWQANPNEVKEWVTSSATESTNPYFSEAPTKPVVDFNVTKAVGIRSSASFSPDTDQIMYFPNLESGFCMFYNCKKLSKWKSPLQSLTSGDSMFMYTGVVRFNTPTPKLTNGYRLFLGSKIEEFNGDLCRCASIGGAFSDTPLSVFSANLDSLSNASSGFKNTRLPAEQISKILDSLPTWTDGKSHIITFTGSPGASELTQDSPSVAAAIAKGWTVEL